MQARYPYIATDRLSAVGLKNDLEFSPSPNPPVSRAGTGAGRFKWWIDTSGAFPVLRQCVAAIASPTYVAGEWMGLAVIDPTNKKLHFDPRAVDFLGGDADFSVNGGMVSTGVNSGFAWFDRTIPTQEWLWYASGGVARLWNNGGHEWLHVNYTDGVVGIHGPTVNVDGSVALVAGPNRGYYQIDRSTGNQWCLYGDGNIWNVWFNVAAPGGGNLPFRVSWDGTVYIAGNALGRNAADGTFRFYTNINVDTDIHYKGNLWGDAPNGNIILNGGVDANGTVATGGDLYLKRTSYAWGYITRPNIGGYKNVAFWPTMENIGLASNATSFTSSDYVDLNLYLHSPGRRLWGIRVLSDGSFRIPDHSAGMDRIIISTSGQTSINASNDPWVLNVSSGGSWYSLIRYYAANRVFGAGVDGSSFCIRDESAGGATRLTIAWNGDVTVNAGNLWLQGAGGLVWKDQVWGGYFHSWVNGGVLNFYSSDGNRTMFQMRYDGACFLSGIPFYNWQGYFQIDATIKSSSAIFLYNDIGGLGLFRDGNTADSYMVLQGGCGFHFQNSTGNCWWQLPRGPVWVMMNFGPGDGISCYSQQGPLAGVGGYVDISDISTKQEDTIEPAVCGLAEIMALKPVTFKRRPRPPFEDAGYKGYSIPEPAGSVFRTELGFIAQDVQAVMPSAVIAAPFPEGPKLGIDTMALIAALTMGMQEMAQRIEALESATVH